jgi:hypothetical protein
VRTLVWLALVALTVFTELSPDNKPLKLGWNRRVLTNAQCDLASGLNTLAWRPAPSATGLSLGCPPMRPS